jgi:hypothetical protein
MSRPNYGVDYGFSEARRFAQIVIRGSLGLLSTYQRDPDPEQHPLADGLPFTIPQALRAGGLARNYRGDRGQKNSAIAKFILGQRPTSTSPQ